MRSPNAAAERGGRTWPPNGAILCPRMGAGRKCAFGWVTLTRLKKADEDRGTHRANPMVKRRRREKRSELVCPYCGEPAEVDVDAGGAREQEFEQDCAVCCRPWRVHLEVGEDGVQAISIHREDD